MSLFVLLCFPLFSSANAVTMWDGTYGGESNDTVESLIEMPDGGYLLAGTWTYNYSEDCLLIKTDPFGFLQWNKTYGGTGKDSLGELNTTADGGYIMAGRTTSYGVGDYDAWLVKFDALAQITWNKTYGGPDNDYIASFTETSDGGYALAGAWNLTTYNDLADGLAFQSLHGDFWLVKTTASGYMLWNKTYGGTGDDAALSLVATSDGGYALAGYTNSYGAGQSDFWLVKTNADGNVEWSKTYGGAGSEMAFRLVVTPDGGYSMAGVTNSFGAGDLDFWLVKTDSMGNMQWSKTYGGTDSDTAHSLIVTSDDGYAIAGQTRSFGAGGFDFWLIKTDGYGNAEWNKTYGGTADDTVPTLIATSDGGYALAGSTWSLGVGGDIWLIKTNMFGIYPEYTSLLTPAIVLTATAFIIIRKKRLLPKHAQT
jgi:hypothetical protein